MAATFFKSRREKKIRLVLDWMDEQQEPLLSSYLQEVEQVRLDMVNSWNHPLVRKAFQEEMLQIALDAHEFHTFINHPIVDRTLRKARLQFEALSEKEQKQQNRHRQIFNRQKKE